MINDKIFFIIDKDREFIFDGSSFSELPLKKYDNYLSATTLSSSNSRTYGYKTPKSTTPEKIEIQSEMNMYEDAGLDPEVDFSISSLVIPLEDSDESYVESYAVEVSILDEKFQPSVKKHGHIDLIFPPALSYCSLYTSEIFDGKNDLYIHIGEYNAFAVVFKNGQYISTRSISTLDEIARKIGIEISDIREVLSTKGIEDTLYQDDEFVQMSDTQEIFSKIVERIAHFIGHKRGVFKLETVDKIYLDFEGLDIPGFLDLFDSYGYENSTKEVLDIFKDVEVGMKHYALNANYALCVVQEKITPVNLTVYERKPTFFKSKVGEFSIVMIIAFILAILYPLYALVVLKGLENTQQKLKNDVVSMKKTTKDLHTELKKQRELRDAIKIKTNETITKIKSLGNTVEALAMFDKDTIAREKMMKDINKVMKKYNLSSKKLEFKNSTIVIVQIIAKYDRRDDIAEFIKDLISYGYSSVVTTKIQKTEAYYESFVEIKI
ncbi:MAG: hypothetical protein U9N02_01280 [Campylobacterota bacterium]|nr:hypothetical protein [Campylobacterota bacterium]